MGYLITLAVIIGLFLIYKTRQQRRQQPRHKIASEPLHSDHRIILARLDPDQIKKAKAVNGNRRQITHALLCGPFGQMFGTEKQCRKYFDVWRPEYRFEPKAGHFTAMFPDLFSEGLEVEYADIQDYHSTEELVTKMIDSQDKAQAERGERQ